MNRFLMLIAVFLSFFVTSCSKKTVGLTTTSGAEEFRVDNVNFEYFTTSSKIKFENDDKSVSATANIRMKKDSVIWISITPGFGIEAARALITRDSVVFINRLDKKYSAYNFRDLSQAFNFDINFELIQSILLGNMPVKVGPDDKIKKEPDYFVVRQQESSLFIENFVDAQTLKLKRVAIVDKEAQQESGAKAATNTLNLNYSDFQQLEERVLPFENVVSLDYQRYGEKKRTEINIQHKKVSFADEVLRFPFSIPAKYERQ